MDNTFIKQLADSGLSVADYAAQESWDIAQATQALQIVSGLIEGEAGEDISSLLAVMQGLTDFINSEIADIGDGTQDGTENSTDETPAGVPVDMTPGISVIPDSAINTTMSISKRPDASPKEGVHKYGAVTFADPTNKKYPIDTEEHIRAAWNYINKQANAGKYSPTEVSAIKKRIVSAWKAKIDKEGPPTAKSFEFTDDVLVFQGGSVKDMGDGRIGGYALMFSNKGDPDLTKDYFSKDDTMVDGPLADSPVFYIHGKDSKLGKRIIGRAVSAKKDDVGIWLETQLNTRDEYEKAILAMCKAGKLGYSTGALSHLVDREPMGKGINLIKMWVVGETSLTPTPAEPRLFVQSLKSLKPSEMAALPNEDVQPIQTTKEINNMADIDIKAEVAAAFKAEQAARDAAVKAEADKAEALKTAGEAGYKKAVDELTAKKMIKGSPAVVKEIGDDNDGVDAFKSWLKTGQENGGLISPDESWTKVAYNVTTGASGAFLVPDPLLQTIQAKRDLQSWARMAPVQSFVVSADHLLIPAEGTKATDFVLTAEAGLYNENEPTIAAMDLILYKYTKRVLMSEEFVADNATNFDAWLTSALARAVGTTENTIFTLGSGTGQPQGIWTGGTNDGSAFVTALNSYAAIDLATMIGLLPNGYNVPSECGFLTRNVSKWGMKAAGATIFAFGPTPTPSDFFGYPCYISDNLPLNTTATLVGAWIFANFTQFAIGEKPGILIQRNPYLYMANGQIGIFANIYRGSVVLQPEAVLLSVNHA